MECEDEIYSIRQLEAREVSINEEEITVSLDNTLRPPLLELVDLLEPSNILEQRPTPKVQIVKPQPTSAPLNQFLKESNQKENLFDNLLDGAEENYSPKQVNQLKEITETITISQNHNEHNSSEQVNCGEIKIIPFHLEVEIKIYKLISTI